MDISNEGLVVSNGGSHSVMEKPASGMSASPRGDVGVNKNVYTTIGVAGVGNLNITMAVSSYRKILLFWAIKQAVRHTEPDGCDIIVRYCGYQCRNFGSGIVNVSNGATLNSTGLDLSEEMPPVRG